MAWRKPLEIIEWISLAVLPRDYFVEAYQVATAIERLLSLACPVFQGAVGWCC